MRTALATRLGVFPAKVSSCRAAICLTIICVHNRSRPRRLRNGPHCSTLVDGGMGGDAGCERIWGCGRHALRGRRRSGGLADGDRAVGGDRRLYRGATLRAFPTGHELGRVEGVFAGPPALPGSGLDGPERPQGRSSGAWRDRVRDRSRPLHRRRAGRDRALPRFLRPEGYGWGTATNVRSSSGETIVFTLERKFELGPVSRRETELLDSVRPHLARAAVLASKL